ILELKNPDLELSVLDSENQIKIAEAQMIDQKVQLESQRIADQASLEQLRSDLEIAQIEAERTRLMYEKKIKVQHDYTLAKAKADSAERKVRSEEARQKIKSESIDAQIAVKQTELDKLK